MKKNIFSIVLISLTLSSVSATNNKLFESTYVLENNRNLSSWVYKASKQCPIEVWDGIKITSVSLVDDTPKLEIVTSLRNKRFEYVDNNKQKYTEFFIQNIAESYESRGHGEGDEIGELTLYRLLEESVKQKTSVRFDFYSYDKSRKATIKLGYSVIKKALSGK